MNAVIIPFANYSNHLKVPPCFSTILLPWVQRNLHKYDADVIYLVGKKDVIESNKVEYIDKKRVEYISTDTLHFHDNFLTAVNKLSPGDKFILLDSDTVIYDYSLITDLFNDLDYYDIINCPDFSVRVHPTYQTILDKMNGYVEDEYRNLAYKIPGFLPNEYRTGFARFTHWIFACKFDFFKKHSHNFGNQDFEPFEQFTRNVAKNEPNFKFKELLQFRNCIYIDEDKFEPYQSPECDDKRCTLEDFQSAKYYHIRSFGVTATQVAETHKIKNNLNGSINFIENSHREMIRNIAWNYFIINKVANVDTINKSISEMNELIEIKNYKTTIDSEKFKNYYKLFCEYHRTHLL